MDRLVGKSSAVYALSIYLPVSRAMRKLRAVGRAARGLPDGTSHRGNLPGVSWRDAIPSHPTYLVAARRAHGNVRTSELAVLAKVSACVADGQEIIEIGTFDGRTTLNLAVNSPAATPVLTLDLPPNTETKFVPLKAERRFIDKPEPGVRFQNYDGHWRECRSKITQLHGDSARFDWSPHYGQAGLVFVDGSHAYEYAMHDSEEAFRLVAKGGMIIWHDYEVFNGVTRALDELEARRGLGLRRIVGTSLAFWRAAG